MPIAKAQKAEGENKAYHDNIIGDIQNSGYFDNELLGAKYNEQVAADSNQGRCDDI